MLVNEEFFNVIDSEIKAYLLGFITADGTINDSRKTSILQVHVSIKDDYIIELLEAYVGCTIKTYYTDTSAAFRTTNQKICDSLSKYGIHPRKTGNETLCNDVLYGNFGNAYIRGLIDGDGWICNTLINNFSYRKNVGFCSSEIACTQLRDFFTTSLGCYNVKVSKVGNKNNYKINYASVRDVSTIIRFLYADAHFFLQRKYDEAFY